jgi:hypothetical protein
VQPYMAKLPQHQPRSGHVAVARMYADIQMRRHTRHTLGMPLPPYVVDVQPRWRTARMATAHGVYMESC